MNIYISRTDLLGRIDSAWLAEATADASGSDAFSSCATAASREVDGLLGQSFSVPFPQNAIPPIVSTATIAFTLRNLYQRRGVIDKENPFSDESKFWRSKLAAIGSGAEPLQFNTSRPHRPNSSITRQAKADSSSNLNS